MKNIKSKAGIPPKAESYKLKAERGFTQHHFYSFHKSGAGFTLIELLVSIAVLGLVSSVVILGYSTMSKGIDLKTATFKILDVLNLAHTRTVASLATSSYGVHFESTQYVLFKGVAYDVADPNNIFYPLPSTLQIANITLAGAGVDIVFDRLTGKTSQNGSLVVRLIADPTRSKTITILSSGRSDIIETVQTPAGTRVSDSRHVHFTYGQNISSTGFLVLTFPNDSALQNITFASYYSGGVFDWSGTVTVAGVNQTLRVHTHANTGASADFSVTRDMRYNTVSKPLNISLDTNNLVNYAVDGTVTGGFWVSNLQAQ